METLNTRARAQLIPESPSVVAAVACPVCRSPNASLLGTVSSEEAAQHFVLREWDSDRHGTLRAHIEHLWQRTDCELRWCEDCGFGFAWPYIAGDDRFYNLAYPSVGFPRHKWEFDRTIREIGRLAPRNMTALEIGAGFGHFLDLICPDMVDRDKVLAVEYNEKCREVLQAKSYRTIATDVREDDFLAFEAKFDLIFMFQVLEHLDGLDVLMDRLRLLSAPRGRLFVAVPNAQRIAFNERSGGLLDMPPNHIGRWVQRAFETLAAHHGFDILGSDLEPTRPVSFAKADLLSSYLRQAQRAGSLANRMRSLKRSHWRSMLEAAAVAAYVPSRLGAWKAGWAQSRELGESLWVYMRRQ